MGLATKAIDPLRQIDHRLVAEASPLYCLIKRAAVDQRMVMHGPRQKVDLVARRQRPVSKEIPLAVIDDGDRASRGQNLAALLGRRHPARRLLIGQVPFIVRDLNLALARPHVTTGQSETDPAVGIDRHHGMQEHATGITFTDFAEPAPTSPLGVELDLAGVLDRQHMTLTDGSRRLQAPAFNQFVDRDLRIVYKPPERHVRSPVALRHLAQADAARAKHSPEKRRPLLSRRTSPNSPRDKSGSRCISDAPSNQSVRNRIIQNPEAAPHRDTPSQSVAPKTCRYASANAGTHTPRPLNDAMVHAVSLITIGGYGSLLSQERR